MHTIGLEFTLIYQPPPINHAQLNNTLVFIKIWPYSCYPTMQSISNDQIFSCFVIMHCKVMVYYITVPTIIWLDHQ